MADKQDRIILVCGGCGQKNRIPTGHRRAKCGACKNGLDILRDERWKPEPEEDEDEPVEDEDDYDDDL